MKNIYSLKDYEFYFIILIFIAYIMKEKVVLWEIKTFLQNDSNTSI